MVAAGLVLPLLVHVVLAYPTGRPPTRAARAVVVDGVRRGRGRLGRPGPLPGPVLRPVLLGQLTPATSSWSGRSRTSPRVVVVADQWFTVALAVAVAALCAPAGGRGVPTGPPRRCCPWRWRRPSSLMAVGSPRRSAAPAPAAGGPGPRRRSAPPSSSRCSALRRARRRAGVGLGADAAPAPRRVADRLGPGRGTRRRAPWRPLWVAPSVTPRCGSPTGCRARAGTSTRRAGPSTDTRRRARPSATHDVGPRRPAGRRRVARRRRPGDRVRDGAGVHAGARQRAPAGRGPRPARGAARLASAGSSRPATASDAASSATSTTAPSNGCSPRRTRSGSRRRRGSRRATTHRGDPRRRR